MLDLNGMWEEGQWVQWLACQFGAGRPGFKSSGSEVEVQWESGRDWILDCPGMDIGEMEGAFMGIGGGHGHTAS